MNSHYFQLLPTPTPETTSNSHTPLGVGVWKYGSSQALADLDAGATQGLALPVNHRTPWLRPTGRHSVSRGQIAKDHRLGIRTPIRDLTCDTSNTREDRLLSLRLLIGHDSPSLQADRDHPICGPHARYDRRRSSWLMRWSACGDLLEPRAWVFRGRST